MGKAQQESREDRMIKFVAALKQRQTRELIEPLRQKIQAFFDGKSTPEEVFKALHHIDTQSEKLLKRFRNRPHVVLAEIAMDENKFTCEINEIGIKARHGDIASLFADAIVSPTDPRGIMAEGVATAIKAAGGEEIEKEAMSRAPLAPGAAIATTAGMLTNLHVIHAALSEAPGAPSSPELIRKAAASVLALAEELGLESVAIPALGTETGKVTAHDSAEAILDAIKAHKAKSVSDVTLISRDEKTVEAFVKVLERCEEEAG